jgi:hypothetical protein
MGVEPFAYSATQTLIGFCILGAVVRDSTKQAICEIIRIILLPCQFKSLYPPKSPAFFLHVLVDRSVLQHHSYLLWPTPIE